MRIRKPPTQLEIRIILFLLLIAMIAGITYLLYSYYQGVDIRHAEEITARMSVLIFAALFVAFLARKFFKMFGLDK